MKPPLLSWLEAGSASRGIVLTFSQLQFSRAIVDFEGDWGYTTDMEIEVSGSRL